MLLCILSVVLKLDFWASENMHFCGPGAFGPVREAGRGASTPSERRAFREAMHDPGVRAVMRCSCPGQWELQHQERCHCWPPTEDLGNKEASEQDHQSQWRASSGEELCMLLELQKRCRGRHFTGCRLKKDKTYIFFSFIGEHQHFLA